MIELSNPNGEATAGLSYNFYDSGLLSGKDLFGWGRGVTLSYSFAKTGMKYALKLYAYIFAGTPGPYAGIKTVFASDLQSYEIKAAPEFGLSFGGYLMAYLSFHVPIISTTGVVAEIGFRIYPFILDSKDTK